MFFLKGILILSFHLIIYVYIVADGMKPICSLLMPLFLDFPHQNFEDDDLICLDRKQIIRSGSDSH